MRLRRRHWAGRSADAYYRQALAEWREHPLLKAMRVGFLALLVVLMMIEILWDRDLGSWFLGLGAGLAACAYMVLHDWAPAHIENWHTGAEAERRTERLLWQLEAEGWTCLHDLPRPFGNVDHLLIGPGGVFAIDSKQYLGSVTIDQGTVRVTRRANPRGDYVDRKVAPALRRTACDLSAELGRAAGHRLWVQGLVAIWSKCEQVQVEQERVVFVAAPDLITWLRARPTKFSPKAVQALVAAAGALQAASQPTCISEGPPQMGREGQAAATLRAVSKSASGIG